MRVHGVGLHPRARLLLCATAVLIVAGVLSGSAAWCWTQAACLAAAHAPMQLPIRDAARAMWRLVFHGGWSAPAQAFATVGERASAPGAPAYLFVAAFGGVFTLSVGGPLARRVGRLRAGSPLGREHFARRAIDRGWVRQRTWARASDLQRLWVAAAVSGRPYLGSSGRRPARMLAAEPEVQPMVIAPPRRKVERLCRAVAAGSRRPGARALDQARHL